MTARALEGEVDLALWRMHFENFLQDGTCRHLVQSLLDDPTALLHFLEPHSVTVQSVAVHADRNFEIESVVNFVRLDLSHIERNAARSQVGPRHSVLARDIFGDDANPSGAVNEDDVLRYQIVVVRPAAAKPLHERSRHIDELVIDILAHSAKTAVRIGEARATHSIEDVEDLLAIIEGVKERSEAAEIHHIGPKPEQVARYPVELGAYGSDIFGSLRNFYSGELFHRQNKTMVEDHAGKIVHTAGVGEKLLVGAVFAHFFMAAVSIANHRVCFDDELSVKIQQNPEHPVRAWVLRPKVQGVDSIDNRF